MNSPARAQGPYSAIFTSLKDAARDMECSAGAFDDRVASIRARVGAELATIARQRNATRSLQSRLPDELWCLVWQDLSLADRISVTRVCHKWRALALACPRVWCLLDVFSRLHHDDCGCQACPGSHSIFENVYSPPSHTPSPEHNTNLHLVDRVVSRSGQLPITLQIQDTAQYSDDHLYDHLSATLRPHAHRISAIHIDFADRELLSEFLRRLPALPSLRILTAIHIGDESAIPPIPFTLSAVEMPKLEMLYLHSTLSWPTQAIAVLSLPSLRIVSCPVYGTDDMLALLHACPHLTSARLCLYREDDNSSEEHRLAARALVRSLREIEVVGVTSGNEPWALTIFDSPSAEKIAYTYDADEPSGTALQALFADFAGTARVYLSCAVQEAGAALLRLTTRPGLKARSISFPLSDPALHHVWAHVPHDVPCGLIVDAAVWRTLAAHVRPMAQVVNVLIVLGDDDVLELAAHTRQHLPHGTFPALSGAAVQARGPGRVSVQSVGELVDALCPAEPIAVKNIVIEGEWAGASWT